MSTEGKSILLVGHCGPDAWMLRSMAQRAVKGSDVFMVNSKSDLDTHLPNAGLLLVNRVLDGSFGSDSGIELIRSLSTNDVPPMMLVSNFEDAQAEAEAAGARPGFGKRDVNSPQTLELVRTAMGTEADAST